jgi:hypothetical protein
MATFWHLIVRHYTHRIIRDTLANILADKNRVNTEVYVLHYDCQYGISTSRTK